MSGHICRSEDHDCDRKNEAVLGEVMLTKKKRFILKELLGIFHEVESTKCKILEADPNLDI